ncbi:MAG TPA: hypothetical protein VMG30_19525 [Acidobacteriota bacterium]|nr:hypothetical protein [Acidobacteriota bacterium]
MYFWKVLSVLVLLLASETALPAQSGVAPARPGIRDRAGICPDIEIDVKDTSGRAIAGALVVDENGVMQYLTNFQGRALVPCTNSGRAMRVVEVHAPEYQSTKVTILPNTRSRLDAILQAQAPLPIASRFTVNAQELQKPVQGESRRLQVQAEKALNRKDYTAAEQLYLQAMKLTTSEASIPNNLGVLAWRRGDRNAAGAWFEMAAQIDPYNPLSETNLAIIRWSQDRREESYKLMKTTEARGYESDMGNYIIGVVSLEKGMNKEAANHLKKVPRGRFPNRDLFLSMALRSLGKTKSADELYRSFLTNQARKEKEELKGCGESCVSLAQQYSQF